MIFYEMNKVGIPKGMNDFSPNQMVKRNYIISNIKKVFEQFGFMPIETPSIENIETLQGKYGDEGDRLIFKILNSGDFLSKVDIVANNTSKEISKKIVNKGLRYDLTVPLARYVVQNKNDITFPFKRYQIQPVWRAERPQKGRYREFFQCDADMIGTKSLISEIELIQLVDNVFTLLALPNVILKVNNRKILEGISEVIGAPEKLTDITIALDKLDKIPIEKVEEELFSKGIAKKAIEKLNKIIISGDEILKLRETLKDSLRAQEGIDELQYIFKNIEKTNIKLSFVPTLARGLDYYTGIIFEAVCTTSSIGSILGGGRYDNLTGVFGLKDVSGVGLSFGLERICLLLDNLNLFPKNIETFTQVMFVNFGNDCIVTAIKYSKELRNRGFSVEVYPDDVKLKKQLNYANKKKIPFVAIMGNEEIESKKISIKNMVTGEQILSDINGLVKILDK